jgi:predicted RNA-binding protein with PUA domain
MTQSPVAFYVLNLGVLLKEIALRAKQEVVVATEDDRVFALGRLMAMHEVVSLMQQQASVFGLELRELGLEGIDPERDLL